MNSTLSHDIGYEIDWSQPVTTYTLYRPMEGHARAWVSAGYCVGSIPIGGLLLTVGSPFYRKSLR